MCLLRCRMNGSELFVEVILPFHLKGTFTYRVPSELENSIAKGKRVMVSFGSRHLYTGLIYRLHGNSPSNKLKEIIDILDEEPIFSEQQIEVWEWISEYYMASIGDVFRAACPSALNLSSNTYLSIADQLSVNPNELADTKRSILNHLLQNGDCMVKDLSKPLDTKNLGKAISDLKAQGFLDSYEKLSKQYQPKLEQYLELNFDPENDENVIEEPKGKKQKELFQVLLSEYFNGTRIWKKKLIQKEYGFGSSVIKALVEKSLLRIVEKEVSRIPQFDQIQPVPELTDAQSQAFELIENGLKKNKPQLLFGVTSSGKTEIYAKLIKQEIERGSQVLYLLPEIGLTGQLVRRLSSYFGKELLCFHSRMSEAEQFETWNAVRSSKAHVILGTRSAALLPFKSLSMIIVDEEHDPSYKQQNPSPRYHARDLAVFMSNRYTLKLILGSATPSLESYYNARREKYDLVRLSTRFGDWKMPEITISDMKEEYRKKKVKASFGSTLFNAIQHCLDNGEQVMLFQNRRGFSPYIQCESCGAIPECPNCDISLTYHKGRNTLSCHYCGYKRRADNSCTSCSGKRLKTKGIGTEKLEEEISLLFPEARISRMDLDTTRGKRSFEKITDDMISGKTNILIGTQMLTKGFDFANIGLAGVINADNLMFFPDFRAFERSFQLLTQVAGRAGRRSDKARVVIQSFQPDTDVILSLKNSQVEAFLENQLAERSTFAYPPYKRIIEVILMHRVNKKLELASKTLKFLSNFGQNVKVLGPEYETIQRLRAMYRMRMILKFNGSKHSIVKEQLSSILEEFERHEESKGVRININVDPQ